MALRVVELFAGVGGFRLGLETAAKRFYNTVWFNQWEPSTKVQHAHAIYTERFCAAAGAPPMSNQDIFAVTGEHMADVPDHDLLVGGFPCQDYSVATTLDKSGALEGKKGKLWWAIDDIINAKQPDYILLENVNTLITKPSKQRGRSFAVILSCLRKAGYVVEWRVINAAEVGYAQRRRRVFIFAAHKETPVAAWMQAESTKDSYFASEGFFGKEFRGEYPTGVRGKTVQHTIMDDPAKVSSSFTGNFENAGIMIDGECRTRRVIHNSVEPTPIYDETQASNVLEGDGVDERYFLDESRWPEWEAQKGAKAILRVANKGTPDEHEYWFKEGGMAEIDAWHKPGRTILTSEANRTPNRSTHVVIDPKTGKKRFLTPLECERLNGFPDNWTQVEGVPERWRYFTMGNALVVDLVEQMGRRLKGLISETQSSPRSSSAKAPEIQVSS